MGSGTTWRAQEVSSQVVAQASTLLREATLDNRLNELREVALTLLNQLESLQITQPPRAERKLRLIDQVRRFECELIRGALDRTGGNQAQAARLLGVKHTTLNAKIKRYKISFTGGGTKTHNDVPNHEIAAEEDSIKAGIPC